MRTPRLASLLLAVIAAAGLLGTPVGPTAPPAVRAATPDLTVVSAARYDVQPKERRIRVTVDLTLRNRLKDTRTTRYFFDYAVLDVPPRASGFRLTTDGAGQPSVRVTDDAKDYTRLRLNLGQNLFSGKTAVYRLTFDMEDPGGAPTRDLRVGDSLVSFPVWAFATQDTPGSSVTVVFPKGYDVDVEAGDIPAPGPLADGRTIFRTGALAKPLDFFAYLVGYRPGAYERAHRPCPGGRYTGPDQAPIVDGRPTVGGAGRRRADGRPARAGHAIGLGWPQSTPPLTVQEAVSRSTGGYAGLFDPAAGLVEIAYYAGDFVVLHEAAHGWFNGALLADRWANEAFASYYATRAATDLELDSVPTGSPRRCRLRASRSTSGVRSVRRTGRGGLRVRRLARPG